MFTGIIEELGEVLAFERQPEGDAARLTVRAPIAVSDASHGDSISISGVCLTVVAQTADTFTADVMGVSIAMSTLGTLVPGELVNVERAASLGSRLGGHIVQGHVDGTARVLRIEDESNWRIVRFALSPELAPLVTRKGSITLDGTSLTVSAVSDAAEAEQWLEVSLIPETLAATTLGRKAVGDAVNVETDILARHVERLLAFQKEEVSA
ncbi:riboflavin synthase [Homoserinibacter sp. YIM 151385]|uniref:riboflavin synthase n=1 Tax=Homoserinibacter sp. YIM 151385 TaxID=2985506 RepID=UPI0022F1092D|nr:riboflavin synthase [Homoserinibacter sp. YIM 151385]WBU36838.1 riboflavin synthase [Homoserinibacter sp. YIM 151385]